MGKNYQGFVFSSELQDELRSCICLPSLPSVAFKIIEISKDPDVALGDISTVISSDPALAVKLLKVVNSPLYSQRRAVNNLREALTLVGLNAALSITLSFSLINALQSQQQSDASQENYWKRSVLSAAISRILGAKLKLFKLDDLFLACLLQDIGVLVLENITMTPYSQIDENTFNHARRIELEEQALGVDHAYIGAWLLEYWDLPEKIVNAVKFSHCLNNTESKNDSEADSFHSCVHLSGSLADIWLEDTPTELVEVIQQAAQIMLGIDSESFNDLISEINNELPKISDLFEIDLLDEIERGRLLDEAREITMERSIHYIRQAEDTQRYVLNIEQRVKNIEEESQYDHVTQAYTRKYIDKILSEEFEYANNHRWPLSLAFIDVDKFKNVNDKYGHLFGDSVLTSIVDFITQNIRESDVIARYGGDEFILMLPGSTTETAEGLLSRLMTLQNESLKIPIEDEFYTPTLSIGLATHMDKVNFDDVNSFIRAADSALYKAKQEGRNCLRIYK